MYSIRRFGVVRTATIVAIMYVIVIAIVFIPLSLLVALGGSLGGNAALAGGGFIGTLLFGLIAALIYGVIGWISTALACLLYNLAAGWVGGIQFQLEAVAPPASPPAWTPTPTPTPTTTSESTTWNPAPPNPTPPAALWETPATPPAAPPPAG